MGRVRGASGPDFVEEEEAGVVERVMEIVLQAAFFFATGAEQGANFSFEQKMLAFFRAQDNDESDGFFRKLGDFASEWLTFYGFALGGFFRFSFGHVGGDCIAL